MKILLAFLLAAIAFSPMHGQITYQSKLSPNQLQVQQFDAGALVNTMALKPINLSFADEDEELNFTFLRTFLDRDKLMFFNTTGWLSTQLYNGAGGSGTLELNGGNGTGRIFSAGPDANDPASGYVSILQNGTSRLDLYIEKAGILETRGQNGNFNTVLSSLSDFPNNGYIFCADENGTAQAGIVVNGDGTGEVFGDTKNFRMAHPERPGKEIWYASLEGPEAAAYERGSANLQYGETFIPFSDHFQLVVNPETMTVILTPHSADTYGLAVIEKTAEGILVKELKGGRGNFGFDWEVKGVRKGYENYRVIRDATELLPAGQHPVRTYRENSTPSDSRNTSGITEEEAQPLFHLGQNRPNPARDRTVIPYTIPASSLSAELRIFDAGGKLIQRHALVSSGSGSLEIVNDSFSPGMYTYALIVDGKLKASKQMLISR